MAVLWVKKLVKRDAEMQSQRNNLLYEILGRVYTVRYLCKLSKSNLGAIELFNSTLTPKIGDSYQFGDASEFDTPATCTRIKPIGTENPTIWILECTYDTDRVVSMVTDNPLNQPAEINWDAESDERPIQQDIYGVTYQSSSANAYDPPVMQRYSKSILRIRRNEATFNEANAKNWFNKINVGTFASYGQAFARVNSITGSSALANGVFHYQVSYEIAFNPYTWYDLILDQDWRDIDGQVFLDRRTGQPLANQTPLNGRGRALWDAYWSFKASFVADNLALGVMDNTTTQFVLTTLGGGGPYAELLKFPPPQNKPKVFPGVANPIIVGPHRQFKIKVWVEDTALSRANRNELVRADKFVIPAVLPNGKADFNNAIAAPDGTFEIMIVTAVEARDGVAPFAGTSRSVFTVTRAQDGTTAVNFAVVVAAMQAAQPTHNIQVSVQLLPYYRGYQPYQFADFDALALPI